MGFVQVRESKESSECRYLEFPEYLALWDFGKSVKKKRPQLTYVNEEGKCTAVVLDIDGTSNAAYLELLRCLRASGDEVVVWKSSSDSVRGARRVHVVYPLAYPSAVGLYSKCRRELAEALGVMHLMDQGNSPRTGFYLGTEAEYIAGKRIVFADTVHGDVHPVLDALRRVWYRAGSFVGEMTETGHAVRVVDCPEHVGKRHDASENVDPLTGRKTVRCYSSKCALHSTPKRVRTVGVAPLAGWTGLVGSVKVWQWAGVRDWWLDVGGVRYRYTELLAALRAQGVELSTVEAVRVLERVAVSIPHPMQAQSSRLAKLTTTAWKEFLPVHRRVRVPGLRTDANHGGVFWTRGFPVLPGSVHRMSGKNWRRGDNVTSMVGYEDFLERLGFLTLTGAELRKRLAVMTPVTVVEVNHAVTDANRVLVRQRIMAATVRGCVVVVDVRPGLGALQRVSEALGFARSEVVHRSPDELLEEMQQKQWLLPGIG